MLTWLKRMHQSYSFCGTDQPVEQSKRWRVLTLHPQRLGVLVDATFQFDDRTNSTNNFQFTGAAPLEAVGSTEETEVIPLGSYTKGQFVRLFLSSTANPALVVAGAKTLSPCWELRLTMLRPKTQAGILVGSRTHRILL